MNATMLSIRRIGRELWVGLGRGFEQSLEQIPGWMRFDRFVNQTLDDIAWGFSLAIGIFWLLRWWIALVVVVFVFANT